VAEHRNHTVLTRTKRATRVAAVLGALALLCSLVAFTETAHAQSTKDRVAATRAAVDEAADRWFDAQHEVARLDAAIADLEHRVTDMRAEVVRTQRTAAERALVIYKGAAATDVLGGVIGDDALDSVRRAELIDRANDENRRAIDALNAATEDLAAKRAELETRREDQKVALDEVGRERDALEEQLAGLRAQANREDAAAAAGRAARAKRTAAAPTRPLDVAVPTPAAAVVVSTPVPTGGTSSHHDHPFLVCTRQRESNGQYDVVSPAGYYGAYQFALTTWDATASHAGRPGLIGVLPSRASVYDQDEMAWALYQWQGKDPWGGRC
jgi:peptidoglycan hydrolase CwlO-like protein